MDTESLHLEVLRNLRDFINKSPDRSINITDVEINHSNMTLVPCLKFYILYGHPHIEILILGPFIKISYVRRNEPVQSKQVDLADINCFEKVIIAMNEFICQILPRSQSWDPI